MFLWQPQNCFIGALGYVGKFGQVDWEMGMGAEEHSALRSTTNYIFGERMSPARCGLLQGNFFSH